MAAWHRHSRCIVNEFYSRGQSGWYKINGAIKTFGHGAALIDRRDDSFLQIDQFSADRAINLFVCKYRVANFKFAHVITYTNRRTTNNLFELNQR